MNCLSFNPYSEFILATGSADKVKNHKEFVVMQTVMLHNQFFFLAETNKALSQVQEMSAY